MRVGTSCRLLSCTQIFEDHPHACGDKLSAPLTLIVTVGSSPCVWGQVLLLSDLLSLVWDHPHACGDKSKSQQVRCLNTGSSPCVWGQEVADKVSVKSARIIPMRVGTRQHLDSKYYIR